MADDLDFMPLPGRGATSDQFWDALIYEVFTTMRVCVPATVKAWNPPVPGLRPATVKIELDFLLVRSVSVESEVQTSKGETLLRETAGLKAVGPRPPFDFVPIIYSGPPSFNMRGPIDVGTTGLYIIADRCIDQWLNTGGPLDPAVAVKHDINDGFFLPTGYHGRNTPTISPDVHQLGPDDGTAGFEIAVADKSIRVFTVGPKAMIDALTEIDLGALATLGVARLTDDVAPTAAMSTFMTQVVTALTTIAAAVPVVIVPPVPPATIGTIATASTKVKAE